MNIYDLAETWFSEYHTIKQKVNDPVAKKSSDSYAKKKALGLKGRKLNEHAYLWGQNNKKTMKEVTEKFNIKTETLRSWIKANNLLKFKCGRNQYIGQAVYHRPRAEVQELCRQAYDKMKNHGWCQTKACAEYKIANTTIQRYIKNLNE
jgi:abortive infection bacteriophage resistance protein